MWIHWWCNFTKNLLIDIWFFWSCFIVFNTISVVPLPGKRGRNANIHANASKQHDSAVIQALLVSQTQISRLLDNEYLSCSKLRPAASSVKPFLSVKAKGTQRRGHISVFLRLAAKSISRRRSGLSGFSTNKSPRTLLAAPPPRRAQQVIRHQQLSLAGNPQRGWIVPARYSICIRQRFLRREIRWGTMML